MSRLPLEGVRIADLTVVWAGPYVTQMLSEWGAEVIRVEPRTRVQPSTRGAERQPATPEVLQAMAKMGSSIHGYPDFTAGDEPWNRGAGFNSHARNKKSMTADITTPEGREIFLRLIERCDVLIENNVPETIEKANITYDVLRERNPKLIMLRMPAFGLSGPYKNYRAYGTHIEAMIGHHYVRAYPDAPLDEAGDAFTGDAVAVVMGAFAVTMALRHCRRTGKGQQIELSQAENFLPLLGDFILDYTVNGRDQGPQGNRHRAHAPHNYYPCAGDDRWIGIDCDSDEAWVAICEVLGADELLADERFATGPGRFNDRDDLDRLLGEYTRQHDDGALFMQLQAHGVIAGPVQNERDAFNCPQAGERGFFEELTGEATGTHRYPGLIARMERTPNSLRTAAPMLGEHNDYVYREVLEYSAEEYQALRDSGQVGEDYAPGVIAWKPASPV